MKTNGWVASSQRFYRWLLRLYPQAYRTTYETEMFHLFTDQCREACKERGRLGVLSLWLRTLVDVGVTVVREHLSDPRARAGLLDAAPNAPLPWKGVLLVLIPGLIFFVSQVEQVTSNNDWFFLAFYRAGYFLILPVLLVWLLARRFPVWGLIPLGLFYKTLVEYIQRPALGNLPLIGHWFDNGTIVLFGTRLNPYDLKSLWIVSACVILSGLLVWRNARRGQVLRGAWKWLGLYGMLVVLGVVVDLYYYWPPENVQEYFFQMPLWTLSRSLPLLLLVFIGMSFSRRHGGLTFLILLGYLLPTILYGRYGIWNEFVPFYVVSLAVLLYRFVVALVAPVWLVRAASLPGRQRAAAIPVAIAILCHISLTIVVFLALGSQAGFLLGLLDLALYVWDQVVIAAGLGLAVALYLPRREDPAAVSPPALAATAE